MISFYTQETSYMKWKASIVEWGVLIKINNENEKYILHFIFHTNIVHIKSSRIPVMINIKITYQLVRRQDTSYMRIYKEKIFKYILIISLNTCESNRI